MRLRPWVLLVLATAFLLPDRSARADPTSELPADMARAADDPTLRALWTEGLEFERRESLLESTRCYETLAEALPGSAFIRWRIARNYWRYAERLASDDKAGRL